jgi:hypothetical protein
MSIKYSPKPSPPPPFVQPLAVARAGGGDGDNSGDGRDLRLAERRAEIEALRERQAKLTKVAA